MRFAAGKPISYKKKALCDLERVNKNKSVQYKSFKHLKNIKFVIPVWTAKEPEHMVVRIK
jgi:hypothetical protein